MLHAVRCGPGADDVVADGRAETWRRIAGGVRFDGGDEELRDRDVTEIAGQPPQFRRKRASVERGISRQIARPAYRERRLIVCSVLDREQPCAAEAGIKQPRGHGRGLGSADAKRLGPLAQELLELRRAGVLGRNEMVGNDHYLGGIEHLRRAHLLHRAERHRARDVVRHHDVAADHDDVPR